MPDAPGRPAAITDRWLDGLLAATVATVAVAELVSAAPLGAPLTLGLVAVEILGAGAVALRRRRPLTLALALSAACFVPGLLVGPRWWNAPADSLLLSVIILAYTVGALVDGLPAGIGLVALCVGSSGGELSDPIVLFVFTVPAWVAGRAMRSRALLASQLADRARELEQEHEAYAREAVRYERARIARDLHDVVAHSLSMIVVQAGAGRRALASDPDIAEASLRHIEGGARRAEHEIAQLVNLLGEPEPGPAQTGLAAVAELVRRAATTGLLVSYTQTGDHDDVSPELAGAGLHVTQEGITNALKHAPGAPIRVAVRAAADVLSVVVENGPAGTVRSGLEQAGGAHGITGLRDRVTALGGDLRAGPTAIGGWRLCADLPTHRTSPARHPVAP